MIPGLATDPLKLTARGLPVALWEMDREALLFPVEVGANVTVIVCDPPLAIVAVEGDTWN